MKTVLITGASGFIGSHLVRYFKAYSERYNVVTMSSKKLDGGINVHTTNYVVSKQSFIDAKVNHVDIVIHVGAFIPKDASQVNDVEKCTSNISTTLSLIDGLPNTPEKFIFFSTVDVYAPTDEVISESSVLSPPSLYGDSKLYCERLLERWANKNKVLMQILRLGHIYGPGEDLYKKLIPLTIQNVLSGNALKLFSNGGERRSFLYIEDLCKFVMNAAELSDESGPLNLVSRQSITVRELMEMILKIAGKSGVDIELGSDKPGRSLDFDSSKVNTWLGQELHTLEQGLRKEYDYFSSIR